MILVLLGTQENSFHRLLEEVQKCIDKKVINEEVVVQAGSTKFESKDMKIFKLVSAEKLNKYMEQASYVITHGGVGSILTCLKIGKKVIAVPRYKKYGEHVNDHQLQIVQTFDGQGFIKGINQVEDLEQAIKQLPEFEPEQLQSNTQNIINIINNYIQKDKKLLFSAYSLDVGGIEKALVTLANKLQNLGYDITIVLERKEGIFLKELASNIKVIEYRPSQCNNILKRKIVNLLKRIKFSLKYKNKFDFSAAFATYSLPAAYVARKTSKNSALWGHADYLTLFNGNSDETKQFFIKRKYNKFKKIIFVSNEGKDSFLNLFPDMNDKTITCNNLIDDKKIIELSKENIELEKDENCVTFLNVGRHEEKQKKLTRLIEVAKKLKDDNYKFKIIFVGDGPDTEKYKEMVKKYKLDENINFLGRKQNPYPYFNISDCIVLTSDYEGYPVVFLESMVLNKPIITTKVSDFEEVQKKFGLVAEKDINDIYEKMKNFIENGYVITKKFDSQKYNDEIIEKLQRIF